MIQMRRPVGDVTTAHCCDRPTDSVLFYVGFNLAIVLGKNDAQRKMAIVFIGSNVVVEIVVVRSSIEERARSHRLQRTR